MKSAAAHLRSGHLVALATSALPAVACGITIMLDQSMRRPSLARVALQSLHMVF